MAPRLQNNLTVVSFDITLYLQVKYILNFSTVSLIYHKVFQALSEIVVKYVYTSIPVEMSTIDMVGNRNHDRSSYT